MEHQHEAQAKTPEAAQTREATRHIPLADRAMLHPMLQLQQSIGNRAVQRLMVNGGLTLTPGQPLAGPAAPKPPSDINLLFNALDASHRLIESIDQSQIRMEDDPDDDSRFFKRKRLVRHVDFPAVVAVLSNLTADEVKAVEAEYLAYEHRPLWYDLFGGGESHVWTDLTADQIHRLKALLGGTRASSEEETAAAAQHRREGDVAELHALLNGSLGASEIERVMTLLRRPAEEAAALLNEYNLNYNLRSDLFRMGLANAIRAMLLLSGSSIAADAYAIGMARNRIMAIDEELRMLQPREVTVTSVLITFSQVATPSATIQRRQQIEALTAARKVQVQLIEELVQGAAGEARKEAEEEGKDALDTDTAIRTRVSWVLGPAGATEAVVGGTSGKLIAAVASNVPAEQVAAHLRKLYEAGDLTTEAMADAFRALRMQAAEEAQRRYPDATADELEEEERKLSDQWFIRLHSTWDAAVIGQGPTFSQLLDRGDQSEVNVKRRLYMASGRLEPADELVLALAGDRKDMETVKRVLRDKKADQIRDLKLQYQNKTIQLPYWPMGRSLDFDLFGTAPTHAGEENPEIMGQYLKLQGKASGTERLILEDYLQRPQKEGGVEEVLYISARAEREYEYTIDNRGATGWWRDHWGNEARSLLDATIKEVRDKREEYLKLVNTDPKAARSEKAHLIIRDMHFARATIRGDRAGYEKATAELRATFQAAASFVLQAVLTAVLTPFATALFAARLAQAGAMAVRFATWTKNMAVGMASTIAANKTVYGNDYNTDMLLHDLKGGLGSAIGATGAERLLGPVTQRLTDRLGKTMAGELIAGAKTVGGMEVTAILEGEPANIFENFLEQHFLGKVGEGITHVTAKAFKPGPKTGTRRGAIEEPRARAGGAGARHEVGPAREATAEPLADELAEPEQEVAVSMQLPEPDVVPRREAKRTPHAEKPEPGAESAEQVPPDPMAGKRAPDEPPPDEPPPREDTDVDIPRAPESERMRANREEQERRARQYPVDVSALRESTSPDARARRLAAAFAPLYPRWGNLHPVERLAALEAVINEQLSAAGLPHVYVESASRLKGGAEFDLKTWKIQVSEGIVAVDKLTPEQFAGICSDAAHEARHALHHFRGLRAALQEGQFNPDAKIKVPNEVVEAAQRANDRTRPAEVLPDDSPAYREGLEIYQQTFGSGAERRRAVKARLERAERQAAEAKAEVEKHPEGSAARQAAELARQSAEAEWREAHNAYVGLPQETDAWRRGIATKAAVLQHVLQDRLAVVERARAQAAADQRAAREQDDSAAADEALARYRAAGREMRELQRQLTETGQREATPEGVAPGRVAGRGTEPGTESVEHVTPEPPAGQRASGRLTAEEMTTHLVGVLGEHPELRRLMAARVLSEARLTSATLEALGEWARTFGRQVVWKSQAELVERTGDPENLMTLQGNELWINQESEELRNAERFYREVVHELAADSLGTRGTRLAEAYLETPSGTIFTDLTVLENAVLRGNVEDVVRFFAGE